MPQLPRLLEVSPFPSLRDGYVLRKLDAPQRIPCPDAAEGSFTVEFEVVRRLSLDAAGRAGRIFTKPLKCIPEKDSGGSWDLKLNLQKSNGRKGHMHYHRLVGLKLGKRKRDKRGRRMQRAGKGPYDLYVHYEVDHVDWNSLDCRAKNLRPVPIDIHRGLGRTGWSKKSKTAKKKRRRAASGA